MTAEDVTIKPTSLLNSTPVIEYGIKNDEGTAYVSHGHQAELSPEQIEQFDAAQALIQSIIDADAISKGLLPNPEEEE